MDDRERRRLEGREGERPIFAPVVFDDDGSPPGGRGSDGDGGYDSDAGLLRILGLIIVLGVVILALVLPFSPISVIGGDGGSGSGVSATARDSMPPLPEGLVAMSKVYDINVPAGVDGPWNIEVQLTEATTDARNLAYWSYRNDQWTRLTSVDLTSNGAAVSGLVTSPPGSIAVLRRVALARSLALVIEGGAPESAALNGASLVSVVAARPASDGEVVLIEGGPERIAAARASAETRPLYLGISSSDADLLRTLLASPDAVARHAAAVAAAASEQSVAGVHLSYLAIEPAQRAAFASLVTAVGERLRDASIALVVDVVSSPTPDSGPYDWRALLAAADALWLHGPQDPAIYFSEVEGMIAAQAAADIDLGRVHLVVDRASVVRAGTSFGSISQRDALALASTIDRRLDGPVEAGRPVTLRAANLGLEPEGGSLRWDAQARSVSYHYVTSEGEHTVWVTNRFSTAFRIDLAARLGLGGVVVTNAQADEALPDIWEAAIAYAEEGVVTLFEPYGPYLTPCWQASDGRLEDEAECWTEISVAGVVVWRAPTEPGVYDVRLVVSDGQTFIGQEVALRVDEEGASPTPAPTPAATATPEPTATPAPTPQPTPQPTATPEPTATPTPEPTASPEPTTTPTATPTGPPGPAGND